MGLAGIIKKSIAKVGLAAALVCTPAMVSSAKAQDTRERPDGVIGEIDPTARLAVLGTNVLLNSAICGIVGAAGNRDGWRDAAQCALGAAVQYAGMEIGMYDVPALPGFALRIVETGTSMIDNTLAGRDLLGRLHYEIGPILLEIDTRRPQLNAFWRAYPTYGVIRNIVEGHEFDLEQTLSYQSVVFRAPSDGLIDGRTTGNVMLHNGSGVARAHEFNHILQYVRYRILQNTVPDFLGFAEDDLHYRAGEDLGYLLFNLPGAICQWTADDPWCRRRYFDLPELESYTMQTATSP